MDYMKRALELARQAIGAANPNPPVGAVVVKDGEVVGEGHTLPPGQGHAENVAVTRAGERARGATLYTTLEPCCIHGRVPPCTAAIIAAGVKRVHIGHIDVNPQVDGKGRAALEAAGIECALEPPSQELDELYEVHGKYITTGVPFVVAKWAMSLDGKIATSTGESRWVTGQEARARANALRRVYDAVMVGVNTVVSDDPSLTARDGEGRPLERQPLRVIVDSRGTTPEDARLFGEPGETLVAMAEPQKGRIAELRKAGADTVEVPAPDGKVDLKSLLRVLAIREVTGVLVEGGGRLLGSLFDARLVDKVVVFISPAVIGGKDAPSPVEGKGIAKMAQALRLTRVRVERVGEDIMVVGYPSKGE